MIWFNYAHKFNKQMQNNITRKTNEYKYIIIIRGRSEKK